MKKEFEVLKEVLFNSNTYDPNGNCNWSEVSNLLEKLWDKIDEVEKRIECAVRSSAEANKSILLYTQRVDNNETFQMKVDDHDSILRGTNDVLIALNMNDTECIDNNWYNLFSPTEEPKPIAVGNIEYDFPEEVYTIGNADNTEIIGDVYESSFHELLDLGILVLEGSDDFTCGKANYIVLDNKFISIVKKKQIDLSKVPIIKKEVFMTFHSSWGEIDCDEDGKVIEVRGDEDDENYLLDIAVFDLVEYCKFCESKNITMGESDDILSIGFWKKDNTYHEAEKDWRKEIFGEEPPTMLCSDPTKHEIVNNIISQLKGIEVDGETMEYILRQVGMEDQMLKQLFAQSTNDEIDYLHDVRNGKA